MLDLRKEHNCTTGKCKSYQGKENAIAVSSKKKTYRLNNDGDNGVEVLDLDDCVFRDHKIADFKLCDYMIRISQIGNKQKTSIIWLELKGANLGQACKQILNANEKIKVGHSDERFARIVLSKFNRTEIKKDSYKQLFRVFGRRLDYASREYNKDKSSKLYLR